VFRVGGRDTRECFVDTARVWQSARPKGESVVVIEELTARAANGQWEPGIDPAARKDPEQWLADELIY
jgi:hypothetical protein